MLYICLKQLCKVVLNNNNRSSLLYSPLLNGLQKLEEASRKRRSYKGESILPPNLGVNLPMCSVEQLLETSSVSSLKASSHVTTRLNSTTYSGLIRTLKSEL